MNFEQKPYRQPNTQPQQQPQQGQAPAESPDAAAIIAARSAAVTRNRQKSERAALLRDVLRIVGVVVLVAGVGLIAHIKHQQTLEEERRQAQREEAERVARAKERAEREAKAEAARKERMAALKAAEAEKLKRKEEERRAREAKIEALRVQKENVKRFHSAQERFRGASLGLLSYAPASDIPAKVQDETWFSCLVPGGRSGAELYEIRALPGKDLHVSRLDADGNAADVKIEEFNSIASKNPFLLTKGSRCYYSPRDNGKWEMRLPVPAEGETLDPTRNDFGDLCDIIRKRGIVTSSFGYEVYFRETGGFENRILFVPFGGTLNRSAVHSALQSTLASQGARGSNDAAVRARLNGGRIVIRRRKGNLR